MTADEIQDKLNETFRHDDYEWGQKNRIKWNMHGRSAEHLDEICYVCPRCGGDLTMKAEGGKIRCTKCGNGAVVNDYYEFETFDDTCVFPVSPVKWVEQERVRIIKEIREDQNYSFTEEVDIGYLPPYKYVPKNGVTEVGYGMNTDYEGHGYMTEALLAFLSFGKTLGIKKVLADTLPDNIKSQNVLKRCGFTFLKRDGNLWWEKEL